MTEPTLYEQLLNQLNAQQVQKIAHIWGSNAKTRVARIDYIKRVLNDPERCRELVESRPELDRSALAFGLRASGSIPGYFLNVCLMAAGYPIPTPSSEQRQNFFQQPSHLTALNESGMIMLSRPPFGYFSSSSLEYNAAIDPRMARATQGVIYQPLNLPTTTPPATLRVRRPSMVTLDITALAEAIEAIDGIGITQNNTFRVADMRKVLKQLGWSEDSHTFDQQLFAYPMIALTDALMDRRVIIMINGRLHADLTQFSQYTSTMQARDVMIGLISSTNWIETIGLSDRWNTWAIEHANRMRLALIVLLQCLRDQTNQHYQISDLSKALFERVGMHIALYGNAPGILAPPHSKDPTQALAKLRADRWKNWQQIEESWLHWAFSSWLYFLGIVELGIVDGKIHTFRITDHGRAVLYWGDPEPEDLARPVASSGPVWVVQPDFEVLAFLDQAQSHQIAFLESVAERIQMQSHVGRYRLSRDSIYRALERGQQLDQILKQLEAGSGTPLPQNIAASLRDWALLREKISMRRSATLIEYHTQAERDQQLSNGISGRPVGDRFILIEQLPKQGSSYQHLNYTLPPPKSLKVDDNGKISLIATPDLYTRPILDRWAERLNDHTWQLTKASLSAQRVSASNLLNQLERRINGPLPDLLSYMVHAWQGQQPKVTMARIIVLQFEDASIVAAISNHPKFKPHLIGNLGERTIMIHESSIVELRRLFGWINFDLHEAL